MTDPAPAHTDRPVLVTGASGYIGGLLVTKLLDQGWPVRVLSRSADRLRDRPWSERVEIVEGDANDEGDLDRALAGVGVAYFLLHSMDGGGDFERRDREMAQRFARAAERAGVGRIVYLGGLHPDDQELSEHLASRVEVGRVFLESDVPAACLQAAVVLGAGSVSFEMLRHLTERLPALIAPKWLRNRIQPIAVDDVLHYLAGAADLPPEVNRTFDIGGPEVLTYEEMMQRFAAATGLRRRLIVPVPVLTPWLASHWVGLVTPVGAGVAKPLVGSLVNEVVCREDDIDELVGPPPGGRTGFDEAVRRAMADVPRQRGPRTLAATGAAVGAAAVVATIGTRVNSRWYRRLRLPAWQPPPVAFPLVWTPLYASIAAVSASVLRTLEDSGREDEAKGYRVALGANLALNAGWPLLFWRVRRLDVAALEAGVLAASSADLTRRARAAGDGHAAALAPYAAWCAFAAVLATDIARRNRR